MRAQYVVWKSYQRRAEILAPLLAATPMFLPHGFRRKWLRPLDYLKDFIVTVRALSNPRPDVVFVQCPPLYAALAPLLLRIPYVIDSHNGIWQTFWGRLPLSATILSHARAVIVHNREIEVVARQQVPTVRIVMMADPVEPITKPVARVSNRVIFICSFDSGEPVDLVANVIGRLPGYEFYVTGDTLKLTPEVRRELNRLPNLTCTGFLPKDKYQELLCSSSAAVVLEERESTQPSGACEAMASDTPLVVSRSTLTESLFGGWANLVDHRSEDIANAIRKAAQQRLDLSSYRDQWNTGVTAAIGELTEQLVGRNTGIAVPPRAKSVSSGI